MWEDHVRQEIMERHNSFVLSRIYSEKRIKDRFDEVPERVKRVPLPSMLERYTGKLYVVDELDKAMIEGRHFQSDFLIIAICARKAEISSRYIHMISST